MNIIITAFLLALSLPSIISGGYVNYNHKRIEKEIQGTLDLESGQYEKIELGITNPPEVGDGIEGKYYVIRKDEILLSYLYVGRVPTCPVGGCDMEIPGTGAFEYFDYLILFDTGMTVKKVTVFNYQAVRGHEICSKGWLKQFSGYDGKEELKVGHNIDAISGATKSTTSITENLTLVQKQFLNNIRQIIPS